MDTRDRFMDLLRALSIGVVVIGHWLMAVATFEHGRFDGANALDASPHLAPLTWLLQVMPLFFLVGGFTNLRGWRSARARGAGYAGFLQGRLQRLVPPTLAFAAIGFAVWLALAAVVEVPAAGAEMLAKPLWFLAVYLLVIAATPVMAAAHARAPLATPIALIAAAVLTDLARFHVHPGLGWANFAFVWLLPHQLGFLYADGWFARAGRRAHVAMAALGLGAVALLTNVGVYAPSLVGSSSQLATNNSPPSVVLAAHALWLIGLALVLKPVAERALARERVWRAVIGANLVAMTVFLWHLTAMAIGIVVLLPLGFPQPEVSSTAWWATRPLWLAALAAILAVLVRAVHRFERQPAARGAGRTGATLAAAVASLAGLATLADAGFSAGGTVALGAGYVLMRRAQATS